MTPPGFRNLPVDAMERAGTQVAARSRATFRPLLRVL